MYLYGLPVGLIKCITTCCMVRITLTIFGSEFHIPIQGKSFMWIYFVLSYRLKMCWQQSFWFLFVGRLKNPTVFKWRDTSPRHFYAHPTIRKCPRTTEKAWQSVTGCNHECIHSFRWKTLREFVANCDSVNKNSTMNELGMCTVRVSCHL